MSKRRIGGLTWCAALVMVMNLMGGCGSEDPAPPSESEFTAAAAFDGNQARQWMDEISIRIEADALSPPQASRVMAYSSVAIYETSVDGMPEHQSLGGQLQGLGAMPRGKRGASYDVAVIMDAAMGHLVALLFDDGQSRSHLSNFAAQRIQSARDEGIDDAVIQDSIRRGILIAEVIDTWASNDGYHGLEDRRFTPPEGEHAWEPTGDVDEPLEPHWSSLRPFVLAEPDQCQPAEPHEFSTDSSSAFYDQAYQVWEVSQTLDEEQRTIAQFWSDDPGLTATPPGHWMALAGQLIDDHDLNLEEASTLYALLGIATFDAVISCWEEKYRAYLMRPVTYIQEHIDPAWEPLLTTPPFPEYTSGHSTFSGAAATILSEVLGDISFEDRTHDHRDMESRHFDDFHQAADEAARSRLYGGIHYPMANENGLTQGQCVADSVLEAIDLRAE